MIPPQLRRVDRRLLMAGAGVVGALLGLVLLVTVFGGDGGEAAPAPSPRPVPAPVAEVKAAEKPAPEESAAVLPFRDPFRQLAGVPKSASSTQTAPSGQAPTSPGPSRAPSGPAPPTTPPGNANTSAVLELKSIVKDGSGVARANITVDGKAYGPAQGEVFSYGYRLERIDGNCVEVSAQGAQARMCAPAAKA